MRHLLLALLAVFGSVATAAAQTGDNRTAREVVQPIVDRIIRETVFDVRPVELKSTLDIQVVDFGAHFGHTVKGIVYAFAVIWSEKDTVVAFGLSRDLPLQLVLSQHVVYSRPEPTSFHFRELGYEIFRFNDTLLLSLRKGRNTLLLKGELRGDRGVVYLRELVGPRSRPLSRFEKVSGIPAAYMDVWKLIGPFEGRLDAPLPPEASCQDMYLLAGKEFTWQFQLVPKVQEIVIKPGAAFRRESYAEWQYPNGTVMLALLDFFTAAKDPSVQDFVGKFCRFTFENMDLFRNQYVNLHAFRGANHRIFRRGMLDDTGAPALPFVEMAIRTGDAQARELSGEIAEYILKGQDRLDDGTLCRPERMPGTVWADDLFMSAPFLMRMGVLSGDRKYTDDAVRQVINFHKYLDDKVSRLYRHGWYNKEKRQAPYAWGRANGWVIWATSEVLRFLPPAHPGRAEIEEIFRRHLQAIVSKQAVSGLWHQVLDRPESYEETSCSAMFLIGLSRGLKMGFLDESYAPPMNRAWSGLKTRISRDGIVKGICRGTEMSDDYDFYAKREQFDNDPRGLGAVITACLEMLTREEQNNQR